MLNNKTEFPGIKNRVVFWVVSCTWGILTTVVGLIVALALLIAGKKPLRFGHCLYFKVGEKWGGVNFGPVIVTSRTMGLADVAHEHGHAIQNCIFGPFMPFVVALPSTIRYWYRRFLYARHKTPKTGYDDVWFEGSATASGLAFMRETYNIDILRCTEGE